MLEAAEDSVILPARIAAIVCTTCISVLWCGVPKDKRSTSILLMTKRTAQMLSMSNFSPLVCLASEHLEAGILGFAIKIGRAHV